MAQKKKKEGERPGREGCRERQRKGKLKTGSGQNGRLTQEKSKGGQGYTRVLPLKTRGAKGGKKKLS